MGTSLTRVGIFWAFLSLLGAILACTGYYLPYWIKGSMLNNTGIYFGAFRRCNYPKVTDEEVMIIVEECGRYTFFTDIPSVAWQACTVIVGVGCGLALLVGFTSIMGCCISDVLNRSLSRIAGIIQIIAGVLIGIGCAVYPLGWRSKEIRDCCGGTSDMYNLGTCSLSFSYYMLFTSTGLLFLSGGLSLKAGKAKSHNYTI